MIKKEDFAPVKMLGVPNISEYLDITNLADGVSYSRIAYVNDATTGLQRNDKGFVTFYLKDCNGNLVTARLFNVEDFLTSGIKSSAIKKHFVKVDFQAQNFNGSMSLIVSNIEVTTPQNQAELLPKFIGKVDVDTTNLNAVSENIIGSKLPEEYSTTPLDGIAQSRINGYNKILDMALASILGNEGLPGIDMKELLYVFLHTARYYFKILKHRQELSGFNDFEDYKIYSQVDLDLAESDSKMLVIDTVRSLVSSAEPNHIISFIVSHAIKSANFIVNASYRLQNTPVGTRVSVGGNSLLRF